MELKLYMIDRNGKLYSKDPKVIEEQINPDVQFVFKRFRK